MIASYIQGMAVGAGLIIAIGAQNAFVLSQGDSPAASLAGGRHLFFLLTPS